MTRLLYWNIQQFATNKIFNTKKGNYTTSGKSNYDASSDRLSHISKLFASVHPAIFVIVETQSTFTNYGRLATGAGRFGSLILLKHINDITDDTEDWSLIPPLQTGPKEAVSVYYNSELLYFTGPNWWSGGEDGISTDNQSKSSPVPWRT